MGLIADLLGETPGTVAVREQITHLLQRHAGARQLTYLAREDSEFFRLAADGRLLQIGKAFGSNK